MAKKKNPLRDLIAKTKAPKTKGVKLPNKPMESNPINFKIKQFLGPRTTASSAAEGRLKTAAKSKYKSKLKTLIASVKKKKKDKPKGTLNMGQ